MARQANGNLLITAALVIGASGLFLSPLASAQEKNENAARQLTAAVEKVKPALVFLQEPKEKGGGGKQEKKQPKQALGLIIDPKGTVVTNHSLIKGLKTIEVVLSDGRRLPAKAMFSDPDLDLAIVKIEDIKPFPHSTVGDSEKVKKGDWVVALSAPWMVNESATVTNGLIGGKVRGTKKGALLFLVDTSISPGIGPGPLIGSEGKFVGLVVGRKVGPRGINSAIPSNLVMKRAAGWFKGK